MRHLALAAAAFLLTAAASPDGRATTVSEYVAGSSVVAVVRVLDVHDVADVPVAELGVLDDLKGTLPETTAYLPFDFVGLPDTGETPPAGSVALLIVPVGEYSASRRFWAAVDAFRGDVPLIEACFPHWLPIENDRITVPSGVATQPEDEPEALSVDGRAIDWQRVSADRFLTAVREALAPPDASDELPPRACGVVLGGVS